MNPIRSTIEAIKINTKTKRQLLRDLDTQDREIDNLTRCLGAVKRENRDLKQQLECNKLTIGTLEARANIAEMRVHQAGKIELQKTKTETVTSHQAGKVVA